MVYKDQAVPAAGGRTEPKRVVRFDRPHDMPPKPRGMPPAGTRPSGR